MTEAAMRVSGATQEPQVLAIGTAIQARTQAASGTVDLRGKPCPKRGRKGLHHPGHPHAFGYKDLDSARCRFCHAGFTIRYKPKDTGREAGETKE